MIVKHPVHGQSFFSPFALCNRCTCATFDGDFLGLEQWGKNLQLSFCQESVVVVVHSAAEAHRHAAGQSVN